jgi:hypothetical protein
MSKELHDLLTEMVKLYQERQCFLAVHAERLCALLPAAPEAPAPVPLPDRETALGLLTAAAKDAERYRWLCEQNAKLEDSAWLVTCRDFEDEDAAARYWVGSDLDAAIDAAIAASKGGAA